MPPMGHLYRWSLAYILKKNRTPDVTLAILSNWPSNIQTQQFLRIKESTVLVIDVLRILLLAIQIWLFLIVNTY